MKFSSYIVVMASSWMIAAAGVVGFNVAVDALGILPVGVSIPGFNKLRPPREQYDLIVNRVDVERFQPRTIFMGTSRVRQSIDPGVLAGTTFAPAYNGALNGGAHFQEIRWFLQVHFEADKKLRYVYIEAFPTALLQYSDPSMAPKPRAPGSLAAGYVSAVFSMGGLRNSARTVLLNLKDKGGPLMPSGTAFRCRLRRTTSAYVISQISSCMRPSCVAACGCRRTSSTRQQDSSTIARLAKWSAGF